MGNRDLGSRIKARLGEWETYGDEPVATSWHAADSPESRNGQKPDENVTLVFDPETEEAGVDADPVIPKAKVAELHAALEHEREQSRRLMDVVAREQILHAVTLKSQHQHKPLHQDQHHIFGSETLPTNPTPLQPRHARGLDPVVSPRTHVGWVILALFIALVCTCLALSLVR